jgi:HEAT repeat protein
MSVEPDRPSERRGLRQRDPAAVLALLFVTIVVGAARAKEPPPPNEEAAEERPRASTAPPNVADARRVSKDDLRFAGRSFREWEWQLLTDLQPKMQLEAIEALRAFGTKGYDREVVAALDQVLGGEDARVRSQAILTLLKVGSAAVPVLVKVLRGDDPGMRQAAADALRAMDPAAEASIEALEQATQDKVRQVRISAAGALAAIAAKQDRLVPLFERLAESDDFGMRQAVVLGLSKSWQGRPDLQPLLLRAIGDDRWEIRLAAGTALIESAPATPQVTEGLRRLVREDFERYRLRHTVDQTAGQVVLAVAREENNIDTVGPVVIDAASLVFQDAGFAGWAGFNELMQALRRLGPKAADAVPALVQLIDLDNLRVRDEYIASAMDVLKSIGPAAREAVPALKAWAGPAPQNIDRDWETLRGRALKALVSITHGDSVAPGE